MKNATESISKSRSLCNLEGRTIEVTEPGTKKKIIEQVWKNLCELWDNIHRNNLHIIGFLELEEREKGTQTVLKK